MLSANQNTVILCALLIYLSLLSFIYSDRDLTKNQLRVMSNNTIRGLHRLFILLVTEGLAN